MRAVICAILETHSKENDFSLVGWAIREMVTGIRSLPIITKCKISIFSSGASDDGQQACIVLEIESKNDLGEDGGVEIGKIIDEVITRVRSHKGMEKCGISIFSSRFKDQLVQDGDNLPFHTHDRNV